MSESNIQNDTEKKRNELVNKYEGKIVMKLYEQVRGGTPPDKCINNGCYEGIVNHIIKTTEKVVVSRSEDDLKIDLTFRDDNDREFCIKLDHFDRKTSLQDFEKKWFLKVLKPIHIKSVEWELLYEYWLDEKNVLCECTEHSKIR